MLGAAAGGWVAGAPASARRPGLRGGLASFRPRSTPRPAAARGGSWQMRAALRPPRNQPSARHPGRLRRRSECSGDTGGPVLGQEPEEAGGLGSKAGGHQPRPRRPPSGSAGPRARGTFAVACGALRRRRPGRGEHQRTAAPPSPLRVTEADDGGVNGELRSVPQRVGSYRARGRRTRGPNRAPAVIGTHACPWHRPCRSPPPRLRRLRRRWVRHCAAT